MYYYEVFTLKDDPLPDLLHTFEKTGETRFHAIYEKAVLQEENNRLEAQLAELQNILDIGYFYWRYIPEKEKSS